MQSNNNFCNYQNKVFIGIDVHLKQWTIGICYNNRVQKAFQQAPSAEALRKYLDRWYPGMEYYSAYEAGFCGYGAHYDLMELGISNIVFNPADIASKNKERCRKTDSVDAAKIARELSRGELEPIHILSQDHIRERALMRYREQLKKDLSRLKIQIRHAIHFNHVTIPTEFDNHRWTLGFIAWIRQTCTESALKDAAFCINAMVDRLEYLMKEMRVLNRRIITLMNTDRYARHFHLLKTVPGVGNTTAAMLLLELGDLSEFSSVDRFCSFLGLVPDCHCSDDTDTGAFLTRRRRRALRKCMIEAAWRAVGTDKAMASYYARWRKNMNENKSIIKVAHKLAKCIKFVLKNNTEYVAEKVCHN